MKHSKKSWVNPLITAVQLLAAFTLVQLLIISFLLTVIGSVSADEETYYGVDFPFGNQSFADEIVDFNPGDDIGSPNDDPDSALGTPDYIKLNDGNYLSLGHGGILTVEFKDNYLIDVDGDDLYVFEVGTVERFKVEISSDRTSWIDLGTVTGQPLSLDIHGKVDPDKKFIYVRITDGESHLTPYNYAGADIDAIGAIGAEERIVEETTFTGSVPLPSEVSTDPKVIGTNAGLALAFVLIFYFAATLFNSTIRDNYAIIQGWLGFIERPINRVTSRLSRIDNKRFRYLIMLGAVAIFALIYSFLDPYFTNGYMGLALFISLAIAILIVTYTYEGVQATVSRNIFRIPAMVRILPIGIAVALAFVLFSRAIDFHPGLIYGIIGAYASVSAARKLVKNQQAITILIGALFLIAIVVFAFFLRMLIPESSIEGGSFWVSVADGILVGIFVIGLEGLLFALLPITFMDGAKVAAWKWWVWLPLFALVVFLFVHIIINEHGGLAEAWGDMEVVMISGMLGLFLTLSALTWLYFQRRRKPAPVKIRTSSAIVDPAQSPQQIFCTSCGAPNTKDSNFCTECGSKLTH